MRRRWRHEGRPAVVKKVQHKVIIATHQPWRRSGIIAGLSALLLLGGWGVYSYTRATTVSDFERAQSERDQLLDERRTLTRDLRSAHGEIDKLKDQVAYLGRSQEIDDSACATVKKSIADLQAQDSDLREQLAFYRGIVSPQESQAGVRVYEFKLSKAAQADQYHYELVLIQSVRHDKRLAGAIDVVFEGVKGSQKQSFKLSDTLIDDRKNLLFSFRYFQEFSGTFRIPEGVRPLRATVQLLPDGDAPQVEDEYDWTKIVQEKHAS